jgi:hypothetical protein
LPNDARSRNRTSAQALSRNAAVNVSSRHPSTAHVIAVYSIAISAAAISPPILETSAAPSRYAAKIATTEPAADARLTPAS